MTYKMLSLAALLATTLSVQASDLPSKSSAPALSSSNAVWSGAYAGISAGMGEHNGSTTGNGNTWSTLNPPFPDNIGGSGFGGSFGITLGYNYQIMSDVVLGMEADVSIANATAHGSGYEGSEISTVTQNSMSTLRARAGYLIDADSLLYATAGLAVANLKTQICEGGICDATNQGTTSTNYVTGYVAGLGFEHALNDHWHVKAEGLYYDLGKSHFVTDNDYYYDVTNSGVLAKLGVNYMFGNGDKPSKFVKTSNFVATNWTSFYVGANAGFVQHNAVLTGVDNDGVYAVDENTAIAHGALGGVTVGYNYKLDKSFVVGVEADANMAYQVDGFGAIEDNLTYHQVKLNSFGTLRGRLGYLMSPDTLVYTTAGIAAASADMKVCNNSTGCQINKVGSNAAMLVGYTVGAGLEHAVSANWRVKVEGLYYDLGSLYHTYTYGDPYWYNVDTTGLIGRVGLNYAF